MLSRCCFRFSLLCFFAIIATLPLCLLLLPLLFAALLAYVTPFAIITLPAADAYAAFAIFRRWLTPCCDAAAADDAITAPHAICRYAAAC